MKVKVGKQDQKTRVVLKSRDPVWPYDNKFTFYGVAATVGFCLPPLSAKPDRARRGSGPVWGAALLCRPCRAVGALPVGLFRPGRRSAARSASNWPLASN